MDGSEGRAIPRRGSRTVGILVGATLLIFVSSLLIWAYWQSSFSERLVIDWRLKIVIHDTNKSANITLPSNIGVAGGLWFNHTLDQYGPRGFAPISTRDGTSTIYIQSKAAQVFTFGDLFNIWGQTFNETCVQDYCADASHPPPFMSDGNSERCLDRRVGLSNGKDWVIVLWSTLGIGNCLPGPG